MLSLQFSHIIHAKEVYTENTIRKILYMKVGQNTYENGVIISIKVLLVLIHDFHPSMLYYADYNIYAIGPDNIWSG